MKFCNDEKNGEIFDRGEKNVKNRRSQKHANLTNYHCVLMVVRSRVVFFCTFSAWLCLKVPVFDDLQNLLFFSCFGWWSSWGYLFRQPSPVTVFLVFLKFPEKRSSWGSFRGVSWGGEKRSVSGSFRVGVKKRGTF